MARQVGHGDAVMIAALGLIPWQVWAVSAGSGLVSALLVAFATRNRRP